MAVSAVAGITQLYAMETYSATIPSQWLAWLDDFEHAGRKLADGLTMSGDDRLKLECQSLQFALYARSLTFVGTCRLLAVADKQLDLRIHTRAVIECALHLEASLADPSHLEALKEDDEASRRSRARKFLGRPSRQTLSEQDLNLLNRFISETKGRKRLNIDDLPTTNFSALTHEFREISADAAHVTFSSLARHACPDADGVNRLIIDPALTREELHQTVRILAVACLLLPWLLIRGCPDTNFDTGILDGLKDRFDKLIR